MSSDLAPAIGAAAFWLFIAIVASVSLTTQMLKHRETQKTIRQAIEKGQTLDPQTLERLLQSDRPQKGLPSRQLFLAGGIMLLALGCGLGLIGWAVAAQSHNPSMLYPGLGAGSLVGLLGVGLLTVSQVLRDPRGGGQG